MIERSKKKNNNNNKNDKRNYFISIELYATLDRKEKVRMRKRESDLSLMECLFLFNFFLFANEPDVYRVYVYFGNATDPGKKRVTKTQTKEEKK